MKLLQQIANNQPHRPDADPFAPFKATLEKAIVAVENLPAKISQETHACELAYKAGAIECGGPLLIVGLVVGFLLGSKKATDK